MGNALRPFRNVSIRGKMLFGFAAVIGLVGLGNFYGIVSVRQITRESLFARDIAFRKVVYLTDAENLVKRMMDAAATAADVGIPEPLSQAKTLHEALERKMLAGGAEFRGDAELGRDFEDLRRRIEGHLRRAEELLGLATDRQWAAFGPARKDFDEDQGRIVQRVAEIKDRCVRELEGSLAANVRLTNQTASSITGVTVTALIVALLIAVGLSGGIVRPLRRLLASMKEAQAGNLSVRAAVENQDETGALSLGFNEMIEDLNRHQNHLEELVDERTVQLEVANDRLETELEVRKITEISLAESEELFRNVLNSMHAGILIVDAERHEILEANAFALELIGARRESVVGRRCHGYLCPAQGEICALSAEGAAIESSPGDLQLADGRRLPVLRSVVPFTHQGRAHLVESFVAVSEGPRLDGASN